MAWEPMPTCPGLPCDPSLDLSFLFTLNGASLSGMSPFLSDECALSLPCSTGTTERVCLVQGTAEALNAVHSFIAEKVREIPQAMTKPEVVNILQPQTTMNPDRAKQVSGDRMGFWQAGEVQEKTLLPLLDHYGGSKG